MTSAWRFPVTLWATKTLALMLVSHFGMKLFDQMMSGGARDPYLHSVPALDGLFRWDSGFYRELATNGYSILQHANVWPGYPLVVRFFIAFGFDVHYAMLLVSNAASLGCFLVLYRLFEELSDEGTARLGLLLFAAYPFHYYQSAAYPESLMVLGTATTLWLARRGWFWRASLALGAATLCRHLSILAGAGLLWLWVEQGWAKAKLRGLVSPHVLSLGVPWLFPAGFAYFLAQRYQDPLAFWHSRDLWGESAWISVPKVISLGVPDIRHQMYILMAAILLAAVIYGMFTEKFRPICAFGLALLVCVSLIGAEGLGRYSASCWPAFLPLAVWLKSREELAQPLLVGWAVFQGMGMFLFAHQYPLV